MPTKIVAYENFATGVVTSVPAEKLPDTAFQRAINTAFEPVVGGATTLQSRPGFRFAAKPSNAGGVTLVGLSEFTRFDNGTRATHQIGVTSDGKLYVLDDVSSTEITLPTAASEFSLGGLDGTRWQFQQAGNQLFAVSGAGDNDAFRLYKRNSVSTVYAAPFGLPAPSAAPTQGTTTAGDMTGTYQLLTTFYNEDTDTESSPSDILTVTLASNQVTFNRNATAQAQATHWRIYILKEGVDAFHWRNDTTMQIAIGTTAVTLNFTDNDLTNLFIRAPQPHFNDPLPDGVIALAWHQSRMFAATGDKIYYSNIGHPDQFDPSEPVGRWEIANPNDGQLIVGLKVLNENTLAILKERSVYALVGDNVQNWSVQNISESLGSYGRYIVEGDGIITFWTGEGPAVWDGGKPELIANEIVRQYVKQGVLNLASLTADYPIAYDPVEHRFLYGIPTTGKAAHLTVLSWSTVHRAWETSGWTLPPITAFATMLSTSGEYRVFFGTGNTVVYELARGVKTDGAANETGDDLHFTGTTAAASYVEFVSSTPPPVNPRGAAVSIIDLDTAYVHRTSATVALQSGTTYRATLGANFPTGRTPSSFLVVLDIPVLEWDSRKGPKEFLKKRFHRAFMDIVTNGDTPILYAFFKDSQPTPVRVFTPTLEVNEPDEYSATSPDDLGDSATANFKDRIGAAGFSWFIRLIGWYPGSDWKIARVAAETDDRSYGR